MCEAKYRSDPQGGSQCIIVSVPAPGLNVCLWTHPTMPIWCMGLSSKSIWTGMIFIVYRVGALSIQELSSGRSRTPANRQEDSESASEPRERGLAGTTSICLLKGFVQDYLTWTFNQLLLIATGSWGRGAKGTCFILNSGFGSYSYLLSSQRHWDRSYGNCKNPIFLLQLKT